MALVTESRFCTLELISLSVFLLSILKAVVFGRQDAIEFVDKSLELVVVLFYRDQ
jgi:hypothetical protein